MRLKMSDAHALLETSTGFFNADNIFVHGKAQCGFCSHIQGSASRNVVKDHRQRRCIGYFLKMLEEAFLRRFIVIRAYRKNSIDAAEVRIAKLPNNSSCMVSANAINNGKFVGIIRFHELEYRPFLFL